ncbi:MAG: ABC transporter permease [Actinomycetota bacterium]|nr:ABC transporter permease [Actinomycetota bacterium]
MSGRALFRWDWVVDHLDEIGVRLVEHLQLTAIAVAVGLAISFPVAVVAFRRGWLLGPVTGFAGVLYTIPSVALFAFLVPYTGLTTLTAEIGLVSYTLLILIRNIAVGLRQAPADAVEAARGIGYTDRQVLWRVRLPLAMPAAMAGLRIATVTTIGLVTVTALIGQGGMGYFIVQRGLRRAFPTAIIVGAVVSVALAVAADALLQASRRMASPWERRPGAERAA